MSEYSSVVMVLGRKLPSVICASGEADEVNVNLM
jgi:hypothetical protein